VLDDDSSIHSLWRNRLQSIECNLIHFTRSQDVVEWCEQNPISCSQAIFLMDFELRNEVCNGLEILEQVGAQKRGYLITSHAEELHIQERVVTSEVWLIPKSLIGYIPLA